MWRRTGVWVDKSFDWMLWMNHNQNMHNLVTVSWYSFVHLIVLNMQNFAHSFSCLNLSQIQKRKMYNSDSFPCQLESFALEYLLLILIFAVYWFLDIFSATSCFPFVLFDSYLFHS